MDELKNINSIGSRARNITMKYENAVLRYAEQENESIICVRMG